jgi:hypothetical protein
MTPGNGYEGAKIANDGSRNSVARRYVLIGVAALGAVVLVVSIWIVVDVLRVRAALDDARIQASDLTEQLKTVGPGGELAIASQLENDITHARSIADGPMWSFSMHLPIFGGDFTVISQALDAVEPVASNGLPALVQLSEDRDNGELGIKDGQIDLSVIRKLTPTLEHSSAVFTQARKQFSAIDLRAAHGFVQSAISEVGSKLDQAQAILSKGADAARLAPGMLGADGPRNYLMVFQNNAEIRSTGGIPGAYAEVEAKDGTLIIKRQGEGGGTGYFFPPALALTKQERALYGTLPANFWVDSNFTPNFPRTAEILRAMYRRKFGTHLDGVISVDPVALARVLQATGPVQVTKDIALSSQNVIPVLLNLIYTKYTHSDAEQNAFFAQAAKKIFKAFITGGGADPGDLIKEIQASIEESRIIVNATRPEEQQLFAGSQIAGELPINTGATPNIGLYLNDSTTAKLEYYLRRSSSVQALSCTRDKVQTFRVSTTMQSVAPRRVTVLGPGVVGDALGAVAGHMAMVLTYYAPLGGQVIAISVDGKQQTVNVATFDGLSLATVPIDIAPGATHRILATITSGSGQQKAGLFRTTPGVEITPNDIAIPSAC